MLQSGKSRSVILSFGYVLELRFRSTFQAKYFSRLAPSRDTILPYSNNNIKYKPLEDSSLLGQTGNGHYAGKNGYPTNGSAAGYFQNGGTVQNGGVTNATTTTNLLLNNSNSATTTTIAGNKMLFV